MLWVWVQGSVAQIGEMTASPKSVLIQCLSVKEPFLEFTRASQNASKLLSMCIQGHTLFVTTIMMIVSLLKILQILLSKAGARGTFLGVQWLRFCTSPTGDTGLIPCWGTKTLSKKKKNTKVGARDAGGITHYCDACCWLGHSGSRRWLGLHWVLPVLRARWCKEQI